MVGDRVAFLYMDRFTNIADVHGDATIVNPHETGTKVHVNESKTEPPTAKTPLIPEFTRRWGQ